MATTHAKMWAALRRACKREEWELLDTLTSAILQMPSKEFQVDGNPLQAKCIRHLLQLMIELGFLSTSTGGTVKVTPTGKSALESEDKFNLRTQSLIRSHLQRNGLPMERILEIAEKIQLPNVPNADTIHIMAYHDVKEEDRKITKDRFRSLLYLYALAGGLNRNVRVFYGR